MSEEQIQAITDRCFHRHNKAIKKAINLRVGVPIGILCALLGWVLVEVYGFKADVEVGKTVNDAQTLGIGIESKSREMSDEELKAQIKALDEKLDSNLRWLIENMNSKYRGANPLLKHP